VTSACPAVRAVATATSSAAAAVSAAAVAAVAAVAAAAATPAAEEKETVLDASIDELKDSQTKEDICDQINVKMDELIGLVRRSLKRTLKKKKKKKKTKSKGGRKRRRTRSKKKKKTKSKGGRKRRTKSKGGRKRRTKSKGGGGGEADIVTELADRVTKREEVETHIMRLEGLWEAPTDLINYPTSPRSDYIDTIPALISEVVGMKEWVEKLHVRNMRAQSAAVKNATKAAAAVEVGHCNVLLQRINNFLIKIQAAHAAAADGEDDDDRGDDDRGGDIEDGLGRAASLG